MALKAMSTQGRQEAPLLIAGDVLFLLVALGATLVVRYGDIPTQETFVQHLIPFSFLFLVSVLVFLIAGLYDKHTVFFKSRLPETILYAQLANITLAALFFFMVPAFGIQPKTNLFIYLILSTLFVSLWRIFLFPLLSRHVRSEALLIGSGEDTNHLFHEINENTRYDIRFIGSGPVASSDPHELRERILAAARNQNVSVIVMPFSYFDDPSFLPESGNLTEQGIKFIDAGLLYENVFDRVSLSLTSRRWLLQESSRTGRIMYAFFKRALDIGVSLGALIVLSPLLILIAAFLKAEGRPAFILQTRVGRGGKHIRIIKFRTMLFDDGGDPERQKENRMTALGKVLRRTQLDELPQFVNVLRGDLSLIGPRPEIPLLTATYEKEIPFYNARHLVEPGISGWAQIKHSSPPKFKIDVEATKNKLSFDLYYLKHRSFFLDIIIALQTVKILLARASK